MKETIIKKLQSLPEEKKNRQMENSNEYST